MEEKNVKLLAEVLSYYAHIEEIKAEIEGMKAYNALCASRGVEPGYSQGDFLNKSGGLSYLVEQLGLISR